MAAILIGSSATKAEAYLTPVYRATWPTLSDPTGANDASTDTYSEYHEDWNGSAEFHFPISLPSDISVDKVYLTVYSTNINTLPGDVRFNCEPNDYSSSEQITFTQGTQDPVNISTALFDNSINSNTNCLSLLDNLKNPSTFHFVYGRASGGSVGSLMRFHMATIQYRYGIPGEDGSYESDEVIDPNTPATPFDILISQLVSFVVSFIAYALGIIPIALVLWSLMMIVHIARKAFRSISGM